MYYGWKNSLLVHRLCVNGYWIDEWIMEECLWIDEWITDDERNMGEWVMN